jgi:hypothetical protein
MEKLSSQDRIQNFKAVSCKIICVGSPEVSPDKVICKYRSIPLTTKKDVKYRYSLCIDDVSELVKII